MFDVSLVFIIGSAASFFPLLWCLNWLSSKKEDEAQHIERKDLESSPQALFLASLKHEGYKRAVDAIETARQELESRLKTQGRQPGKTSLEKGPDIPSTTRNQLRECTGLVETLFSSGTSEKFCEAIRRLEADYVQRNSHWKNHAAAAVGLLHGEMKENS